jgi:uncharacterized BrkB/YihY/UPF0761 family membrane protein
MKTKKLILVVFVLMSNLTFSQADQLNNVGFWNQNVVGFKLYELVIAITVFVGLFIISYFVSTAKEKH